MTLNTLTSEWRNVLRLSLSISIEATFFILFFFVFFLNPPDRTVLLAVGMTCVLGFSASCVALPGFSNHQEVNPSGFKSRALLSTTDYTAIKVK